MRRSMTLVGVAGSWASGAPGHDGACRLAARPRRPAASAASARGIRPRPRVAAEGRVVTYPGAEVKVGAERSGRLVRVARPGRRARAKGDLLAEIESDELRAALAEARARVAEAEAEEQLAECERRAPGRSSWRREIVAVNDLDQATRDIDIARARKETAKATVTRYEAQLRKSRMLAPITGTVIARRVDAGQTVEAGDAAFTLADLDRVAHRGRGPRGRRRRRSPSGRRW